LFAHILKEICAIRALSNCYKLQTKDWCMPTKKSGNFDLSAGIIATTKEKLQSFLSREESATTEITLQDGKISFKAEQSILDKISAELGKPSEHE
jgi:hypothetical protein